MDRGEHVVFVVLRGDDTEDICVNINDLQKADIKSGNEVLIKDS